MSLDVYLRLEGHVTETEPAIFVRESGSTRKISRAEWDEKFPGCEPFTCVIGNTNEVFHYNITHNLGKMAGEAGIYQHLWRPEEIGITHAVQLIEPLQKALDDLKRRPNYFKTWNAPNGWGVYEDLVRFVEAYFAACREYPAAEISVSR